MIGYVTVGTNDLERSAAFYDGIADILGHGRIMESDRSVMWGTPGGSAIFCTCLPYDKQAASAGNGTMVALNAKSEDEVQGVYDYALANGGSDEGAPGLRGESFYGAYFRDPDGNKLAVFLVKQG